jgi:hypothetical protein
MRILLCLLSLRIVLSQEIQTESYLGNLTPVIRSIQKERGFPMDYAHRQGISVEEWRARGRAEVQRALSYSPKTVPLDAKVHAVEKRAGYELRVISFTSDPGFGGLGSTNSINHTVSGVSSPSISPTFRGAAVE